MTRFDPNRRSSRPLANLWARATLLGFATITIAILAAAPRPAQSADPWEVLPAGKRPDDSRLMPPRDLNGYFPFEPPSTAQQWQQRAEQLRMQLRVALGLWPMPTRTDLRPVVHGRRDMGDYTVEKVYFESLPNFYVTGNLYRPAGPVTGKRPGVLCPHGHFPDGRFGDAGQDAVRQAVVQGAERFEEGGRNSIQARCVQLARMGCVVFNYDMIGYCDSTQISFEVAHRFARQRPEMIGRHRWGLFSPQAESHLQSVMGLQTYNSIRALDWLTSLGDVDPQRIAVTGASGGGTQTFILCAIDPRPAVAVPAVMVSTAMQGGCTCENASLLRVGAGNVHFAALFAPKPLGLISANDWTHEMETKGFPQLRQLYAMLGAENRLMHAPFLHFGHNYNYVSRAAMYQFLNRHLTLGLPEPIVEEDYDRLGREELTVWDEQHPRPAGGPAFEKQLLGWLTDDAVSQLARVRPIDESSLQAFRKLVQPAMDVVIGRTLAGAGQISFEQQNKVHLSDHLRITGLLHRAPPPDSPRTWGQQGRESLPIIFLIPSPQGTTDTDNSRPVAVWPHVDGKRGLWIQEGERRGELRDDVRSLLQEGVTVVGVDLFLQGEFLPEGKKLDETPRVDNPREAAAYTLGYNRSVFARRVHDLLTVIAFAREHERRPKELYLIGLDGAGPWVAAARSQAKQAVDRAVVDTQGFRFQFVMDIRDPQLLPGGAKYHDLPGMLALAAPATTWVAGEDEVGLDIAVAAYRAAGAANKLQIAGEKPDGTDRTPVTRAALRWLVQ